MSGDMGKLKQRQAANTANAIEAKTLSVNERILKDVFELYADGKKGLVEAARSVGLTLLPPRKKITVLLIGNHSAGKSSFINWYVEEHIQKTGVAIETQGFTFITSGRKRESLTGNATLHLYPHFKPLSQISGAVDYLTTEIATSKAKRFPLVTFIDTPGLVDGEMAYPFDVNRAILWLGDLADLIFVFFDPIGQALCKRTLNIVEKLSERQNSDRIRFYLSKADEAGSESDRQRVLMQIVQEICRRPALNKTCFDMPTIYIPEMVSKPTRCANHIEEVGKEIEKTINQTVQNTLNALERDCDHIAELVDLKLQTDDEHRRHNFRLKSRSFLQLVLATGICLGFVFLFVLNFFARETLAGLAGEDALAVIEKGLMPFRGIWALVPSEYVLHFLAAIIGSVSLLTLVARWSLNSAALAVMDKKQKRALLEHKEWALSNVKIKKQKLYGEYLQQSVSDCDF